jgi:hypothetical protein
VAGLFRWEQRSRWSGWLLWRASLFPSPKARLPRPAERPPLASAGLFLRHGGRMVVYQIEFIRNIHGRGEAEVLHVSGGQFASVDDAIQQGKILLATTEATRRANGFRIREDDGRIIVHWSQGGL